MEFISFANPFIEGRGSCPEAYIAKASLPTSTVIAVYSAVSTDEAADTESCGTEDVEVEIAAFHQGQPIRSVVKGKLLNRGCGCGC